MSALQLIGAFVLLVGLGIGTYFLYQYMTEEEKEEEEKTKQMASSNGKERGETGDVALGAMAGFAASLLLVLPITYFACRSKY